MIEEKCKCRFVQSDVKIRVPVFNMKSYDVIYRIPEPFLISNIDDKTTKQPCLCASHTEIVNLMNENYVFGKNVTNFERSKNNSSNIKLVPSKNRLALRWIQLMPNERDLYLTPKGKDTLDELFQLSKTINGINSSQGKVQKIITYTNLC